VRILVAGATGTLGVPLVRALLRAGHEVVGLARTPSRQAAIEALGATAVVADALDAGGLEAAARRAAPEAVVHALSALPRGGPTKASDLEATNLLRVTGTANLLAAAVAAGARRLVAESMVFAYGYGDFGTEPLTEDVPLAPPDPAVAAAVEALRRLERQVLRAERIEGVALRYGLFYGAGTGSTRAMVARLRRRMLPLPGGGHGIGSWIHVHDAATATVAALQRGRPARSTTWSTTGRSRGATSPASWPASPARPRPRRCRCGCAASSRRTGPGSWPRGCRSPTPGRARSSRGRRRSRPTATALPVFPQRRPADDTDGGDHAAG